MATVVYNIFIANGALEKLRLKTEDRPLASYGVLGYAYGIPLDYLIVGSSYAADFPTSGPILENEIVDWGYIIKGYFYVQGIYK